MTQQQIEGIVGQIAKFLKQYEPEAETVFLQINVYRGNFTGISVVPPHGGIKHYTPRDLVI